MQSPADLKSSENEPKGHSWFSNPLDWSHIDRLILLAGMVLLVPIFFGGVLALTLFFAPEWLNHRVAVPMFALHAGYLSVMLAFVLVAFRKRQVVSTWPVFEDLIIYSYVAVVFIQSWLSGTHYTTGMLLLMIGAYMTSALADIRKVLRAYVVVVIIFAILGVAEASAQFTYAPIFAKSPYKADGSPVWGWFAVQVTQVSALLVITYVGIMATKRWVERENLFREMSTIDGLTRLTNRRSFIERSQSEFARARRVPISGISCIMIDIDHFKKINDTLGHHAGDAVLVQTAGLLLASARQYDEVGRYGGEEFAVLLPETTLEVATQVAERLREKIAAQSITVDGKKVSVTASFGVACFPGEGVETINDLLKAADAALYRAKHAGRNRVVADARQPRQRQPVKKKPAAANRRKSPK
ncbi:MAG: GGDEF domain-containing protein [Spirochaetota bacterium]